MSLPIHVSNLSLIRGRRPVLSGFSLSVAAGERVAITGPSGTGKSSLLLAIAGLLEPSAGRVRIGEEAIRQPIPRVALMQQRPALLPWASAFENVALGLRFAGAGRSETETTVRRLLAGIGLSDHADALPYELSGGQQQRIALARALARDPAVLLLDEPFSALDPEMRASVRADVARLTDGAGITTLLVTHDAADATALCHRTVSLAAPRELAA